MFYVMQGPHPRSDSMPSSREASEEPEFVSRPSRTATWTNTTPEKDVKDTESFKDERKKRRFSITSFRRSSRSRSRPSSIAIPSNTTSFSNVSRETPHRDLSRIIGEDRSRPHSYHAPEAWNMQGNQTQSTPPRDQQSRLGILPSPAKSAFSAKDRENEEDVPPVPRLPDTVCVSGDLSHEVLQSVIRYATPPLPAANAENKSQQRHEGTITTEPESMRQLDASPHLREGTSIDEKDEPLQAIGHSQWPLVAHPKQGASISSNDSNSEPARPRYDLVWSTASSDKIAGTMYTSHPTSTHDNDGFDEDDQPPQLSHDPIPQAPKTSETDSLPAYLVPTHLDVSDDEDYVRGRKLSKPAGRFSLGASGAGAKGFVSPLPSTKKTRSQALPKSDGIANDLEKDRDPNRASVDSVATAKPQNYTALERVSTGAQHAPLRRNSDEAMSSPTAFEAVIQRTASRPTIKTETYGRSVSRSSIPRDDQEDTAPGANRGEQALSPAPVWFAKGSLQLHKTRTREAKTFDEAPSEQIVCNLGSDGDALQPGTHGALRPPPTSADGHGPRRVSAATPFQVVHAVEEYAASDSSLASWDRDSIPAKSRSSSSQPGDMRDESDVVTPVAQVPRITQNGQAGKAEVSNVNPRSSALPNNGSYFGGHELTPNSMLHPQQQSSDLSVPERSVSLLSKISSMVSDGGTLSPTSSNAGRSTPSTIRRMQLESSASSPSKPARIPEESAVMYEDRTTTAKDDDYDLYADHNGIVKDVRDERGQPLRVAEAQLFDVHGHPVPSKPIFPDGHGSSHGHDEDGPRYSTERPMSFISGPADQDGRPQDQVNQPLRRGIANAPPSDGNPRAQAGPANSTPSGSIYSTMLPDQNVENPRPTITQQNASQAPPSMSVSRPSQEGVQNIIPPKQGTTRPPVPIVPNPGQPPHTVATQPPLPAMNGQLSGPGQFQGSGAPDSRMYSSNPGQPMYQGAGVQGQGMRPDYDPRSQRQPSGPSPGPGPRNEYEFQQHMMHLQAQYPRPQGPNGQPIQQRSPASAQQSSRQPDKPSTIPKLSAVFKGFGGKKQAQTQQVQHAPVAALQPQTHASSGDPNRNGSYSSVVSNSQREQQMARPLTQSIPPAPPVPSATPMRPPSNGAESHFSQVSQGSTRVQPTDSRLDLRYPASPAPSQGIPPQQMPPRVPMQNGQPQPQPYRVSTSVIPEAGKKKRFSTLGNFFGRGGDAQPKLSKQEKKAQKAQRYSSAPQMQTPGPQWQQQQQQSRPPPGGIQYPTGQHPQGPYPPGQFIQGQYPPGQFNQAQYASGQHPPQMRPVGPQSVDPRTMSPVSSQHAQGIDPYGHPQQYQQMQPRPVSQQQIPSSNAEQPSAYLRTRQLAEQHKVQQAAIPQGQVVPSTSNSSVDQIPSQSIQTSYGPPPGGYYDPFPVPSISEQGAYHMSQATRLQAEQQRQRAEPDQVARVASPAARQRTPDQLPSVHNEEAYRALQAHRMRLEQERLQLESEHEAARAMELERQRKQNAQPRPPQPAHSPSVEEHQQARMNPITLSRPESQQPAQVHQLSPTHGASHDELLRAHQERQQQEQYLRSQQYADMIQPELHHRSVSGPTAGHTAHVPPPVQQRHVSSPIEPQYEQPQIPAAYSHVAGAYISPRDREQQPLYSAPYGSSIQQDQPTAQYSDPRMPSLSPQVSAQSQKPPNDRTTSDASSVSVVSPVMSPAPDAASTVPSSQRMQKPRMTSISEIHQSVAERPWHMNFPEGATEQEIVRARQRQFMQQQFEHAERNAGSPSPRASSHSHSPVPGSASTIVPQQQAGGFKELLPRSSPQPYQSQLAPNAQLAPLNTEQATHAAAYPLPMSPASARSKSPGNPLSDALSAPAPPPKSPQSPMHPTPQVWRPNSSQAPYQPSPPQEEHYPPPAPQERSYDSSVLDEPPPSYDGPGVPNDGMDKSRPDHPRPPNIATDPDLNARGRGSEPRPRQASIGLLQHPQPASMAASPQRDTPDMGAESLRRQLLQQDDIARMERIQRAQMQRAESEREKAERDAARARARELERSVSGGIRVGSIRSVAGSRNGGQPGWERRGSTSRPVFELPAVEDDEPAMKATSYPGQEWVPPMWTDD